MRVSCLVSTTSQSRLGRMTSEQLATLEAQLGQEYVQVHGTDIWAFRHDGVVSLCTVGLPQNYRLDVYEPDLVAGVALLNVVLGRTDSPWLPGRVWINDVPFLEGTRIQALVVGQGDWAPVYPLTVPEAELVARETLAAITIMHGRNPRAFCDLFRTNAFPEVSDTQLEAITVATSLLARTAPLRSLHTTEDGTIRALTDEEPVGYEDFEPHPALELLPRIHGSRLFFHQTRPGETLRYGHQGWEYSVT